MPKLIRFEFLGSWLLFWLFSITVIGVPLAILYLLSGTVVLSEPMEDPERFVSEFRAGRLRRG